MVNKVIHPNYHKVVIKTFNKDGSELIVESASTFEGDVLVADVNYNNHPAWKGDTAIDAKKSVNLKLRQYLEKYGNYYKVKESN